MKAELIIIGIIAVVASSLLNADRAKQTQPHLAETKLRIQQASEVYAKSQVVEKVATNKTNQKPNEG